MKKYDLPRCPYCKKRMSLLVAWAVQRKGDYLCDACNNHSHISFDRKSYLFSWICELTALLLMILILFFQQTVSFFNVILVLLPFLIFYLFIPYQMELHVIQKSSDRRRYSDNPISVSGSDGETKVMDAVKTIDDENFDAAMREIRRQQSKNGRRNS